MSMYPPVRDTMIRLLSTPRLGTYANAQGGSVPRALELYRWNLDVSMALFESIHYFEVAFRNTVDAALAKYFDNAFGTPAYGLGGWLETTGAHDSSGKSPAELIGLNGTSISIVQKALGKAKRWHDPVNHGHLVAELTLGFWQYLVKPAPKNAGAAHHNMWGRALKPAFLSSVSQSRLARSTERIVDLRNRIAHHEPLIGIDLPGEYENLIRTAEQVAPGLGWWIDATSRVEGVLIRRP